MNKRLLDWCSRFFCSNFIITGDFNHLSPFSYDEDLIDGYLSSGLGPIDTHRKGNRLDKFIVKGFSNIDFTVLHLDYDCSDHRPIMLKFPQGSSFSPSRWRFPDWILSVDEVVEDLLDIPERWPARIRARAINWVKVLLSDEAHFSSMSLLRIISLKIII